MLWTVVASAYLVGYTIAEIQGIPIRPSHVPPRLGAAGASTILVLLMRSGWREGHRVEVDGAGVWWSSRFRSRYLAADAVERITVDGRRPLVVRIRTGEGRNYRIPVGGAGDLEDLGRVLRRAYGRRAADVDTSGLDAAIRAIDRNDPRARANRS